MVRQLVSSSDLRSFGYDSETSTLEIEFNSGGIYIYLNVPYYEYQNLLNSSSKGKYFHAHIKHYPYRRIR